MGLFDRFFGTPTQKQFAMALIKAIKKLKPSSNLRYDEAQFRLVDADESRETNLSNIYQEHCRLKAGERADHIQRLANIFSGIGTEISTDSEEARQHLRPKIWNRSTFEELELRRRIKGDPKTFDLPLYPLGSHLYSSLVYDLPTSMRSVSQEEISNWGLTIYEALEIAAENLQKTPTSVGRMGTGFYCFTSADNYDSARVLLTDMIRDFEIEGDLIAMVPQRDACFICGSEDLDSLKIMLTLTQKTVEEEPRPLSPVPLILRGDEWHDWMPAASHPLYSGFHRLKQDFYGSMYASQKETLEELLEQQGDDIFVASYSGIQLKNEDRVLTYCVWGEGIDSLLPETDLIMLPTDDNTDAMGRWDDVRRIAGPLMQRHPDYYPPRYRVREFPSQQQLADLGTLKIEDL